MDSFDIDTILRVLEENPKKFDSWFNCKKNKNRPYSVLMKLKLKQIKLLYPDIDHKKRFQIATNFVKDIRS